ncbi:hypothetical protein [Diaphorobacter aerolatus]|uniref:Uncharacterized protein n=1 Tax=Diaphorobacter aerolatus TaxID=1288495 RepID=A0A7H0GP45_9BURK|nr:hypothetical protein [Diaphorobacter aerolatus]QNP50061.1 hypothetical protein H9K75_09590 [Diaphorobacter aerolatus]
MRADDSKQVLMPGMLGYVLSGQTRRWSFPAPANAAGLGRFEAMINRDVQPLDVVSTP